MSNQISRFGQASWTDYFRKEKSFTNHSFPGLVASGPYFKFGQALWTDDFYKEIPLRVFHYSGLEVLRATFHSSVHTNKEFSGQLILDRGFLSTSVLLLAATSSHLPLATSCY